MKKTLIIGYGNPLRGDDGLGWEAAHRLERMLREDSIVVMALHQLTPELAEPISHADRVIFIDSSQGDAPGRIHSQALKPLTAWATDSAMDHVVHPSTLLRYALELYGSAPQGTVFSVVGQSFGYGESLSPVVSSALDELIVRVHNLIVSQKGRHSHA